MEKPHKIQLYLILLAAIIIFSPEAGFSQTVKVRKVKGKNAIIESSVPLEEGQTYQLMPEAISEEVDYKSNVGKSRDNSLTLGAQFDFLKSDTVESTNLNLQARYGWNFTSFEIGTLLGVDMVDTGSGATTTILAGGYVDYNLVSNRDPNRTVYGPFLLAAFGSTQYPSSTAGGSTTLMQLNGGAFVSYFFSGSSTALRGELYANYQQVNTSAAQNNVTGAGGRALLVFYF